MNLRLLLPGLFLLAPWPSLHAAERTLFAGAAACPAQAAFAQEVTLAGLATGGSDLSFSWVQLLNTEGHSVALTGANGQIARFVAPNFETSLTFRFSASGSQGQEASDTVVVEVSDRGASPPGTIEGTAVGETMCNQPGNVPAVGTVPAVVHARGGGIVEIPVVNGRDPDNTTVSINGVPVSGVAYVWTLVNGAGLVSAGALTGRNSAVLRVLTPVVQQTVDVSLAVDIIDAAGCGTRYPVTLRLSPLSPAGCSEIPVAIARATGFPTGQTIFRNGDELLLDSTGSGVVGAGGSGSLTYSWTQLGGEEVLSKGLKAEQARIKIVDVKASESLEFQLRVETQSGFDEAHVTIPASPLFELFFSQVAFGPAGSLDLRSVPILVNDSEQAAEVQIGFFDRMGRPLNVLLEGEPLDREMSLSIPSHSARRLALSSASDDIAVGWARIVSDVRLTGLLLYSFVDRISEEVFFELGLFSSQPGAELTTFFGRDDGLAVAVANPTDRPATLDFEISSEESASILVARPLVVPPGGHMAFFLDESFFGPLLVELQEGTLRIRELEGGSFIATILTTKDGLIQATLPTAVRRGTSGVIGVNLPPQAVLRLGVGDFQGELQDPPPDGTVAVVAPVEIVLDAGSSADDLGEGNLTFAFTVEQNLTSGGAILTVVSETVRSLQIADGTVGSIIVTLTVTDSFGESDSTQVTFRIN